MDGVNGVNAGQALGQADVGIPGAGQTAAMLLYPEAPDVVQEYYRLTEQKRLIEERMKVIRYKVLDVFRGSGAKALTVPGAGYVFYQRVAGKTSYDPKALLSLKPEQVVLVGQVNVQAVRKCGLAVQLAQFLREGEPSERINCSVDPGKFTAGGMV